MVLFSESSMSQIYFELASISKYSNFRGFAVFSSYSILSGYLKICPGLLATFQMSENIGFMRTKYPE